MAGATQQRGAERGALPAIFAVFLGLMIAAVVGLGVYTFMPSPGERTQQQVSDLSEQRDDILGCSKSAYTCRSYDELTVAEKARYEQLTQQIDDLQDRADQERDAWAQRTAIVLIVVATALMALSLLMTESMVVLSNGILLGGLLAAAVHIAFAFNMIVKMLYVFSLSNTGLFAVCTLGTLLVFAAIYALVYAVTARAYYRIVRI